MSRFSAYGPLDDPPLPPDGDAGFRGFRSRLQPGALPPGVARYLENMRCERGTARVRKGAKALSTDLVLGNPPLVLDFELAPNVALASVTRSGGTATATSVAPHGYSTGNKVAIEGAEQPEYDGDFTITVTGASTFTYAVTGTPATPATGTITANKGPVLLETYADVVRGSCEWASSTEEGILIITTDRAYLYREGQMPAPIEYPVGQQVTAACEALQFLGKVFIWRATGQQPMVWDANPANDFVLVTSGVHPGGGTLIRMPQAAWGMHFNRRLVLPYTRYELILSDFGDSDTYDTQYAQLRMMQGTVDELVWAHAYQEVKVLVLFRRSLHLVLFTNLAAAPTAVQEITRDVGCVARGTVQTCGDLIVWLSDVGVLVMPINNELSLRNASTPLSEPIQDIMDRVNWAAAGLAQGRYWNNRYYLAVPLDGSTVNNVVLVFNFLNRGVDAPYGEWESVDVFPGSFDLQAFRVVNYQGRKRLHGVTTYGFVFLLEQLDVDEYGNTDTVASYTITGKLWTRQYRHGGMGQKRYTKLTLQVEAATAGDAATVDFVSRNPDETQRLAGYSAANATDANYRQRLRQRGSAGAVEIVTTAGRPEFKSILVDANDADRAPKTRE